MIEDVSIINNVPSSTTYFPYLASYLAPILAVDYFSKKCSRDQNMAERKERGRGGSSMSRHENDSHRDSED